MLSCCALAAALEATAEDAMDVTVKLGDLAIVFATVFGPIAA